MTKDLVLLGANVIILDVQKNDQVKKIKDYKKIKNKIYYFKCDTSKKNNVEKVKNLIIKKFKSINVLINAASITDAVEKKITLILQNLKIFLLKAGRAIYLII